MHNRMFNTQPKNTSPGPLATEEQETQSLQDLQEIVLQEEERQENKREKKGRGEGSSQEEKDWWEREQERQSAWDVPCPPGKCF